MCLGWGWYLQVDFQLFILGILLLYLYSIKNVIFHVSSISFCILSSIYVFLYCQLRGVKTYADLAGVTDQDAQTDFFTDVYITPYGRGVSYVIGLVFGVLFMEYRRNSLNIQLKRKKVKKEGQLFWIDLE